MAATGQIATYIPVSLYCIRVCAFFNLVPHPFPFHHHRRYNVSICHERSRILFTVLPESGGKFGRIFKAGGIPFPLFSYYADFGRFSGKNE